VLFKHTFGQMQKTSDKKDLDYTTHCLLEKFNFLLTRKFH